MPFAHYEALAAPARQQVKITAIKALQLKQRGTLIRVETDAGISGYGECAGSGPAARSAIAGLEGPRLPHLGLIGKDPLAIQVQFHNMFYGYPQRRREMKVYSGIDMALWDLAGRMLNLPVSKLLGGNFRDEILLYSHCPGGDFQSKEEWRERAQQMKSDPHGFKAYKVDIHHALGLKMQEYSPSIGPQDAAKIQRAYTLAREALATRSTSSCTATANWTRPARSAWRRRWSRSSRCTSRIRWRRNSRRRGWRCGARRVCPS